MLSPESARIFGILINFGHIFGFIPYRFVKKDEKLECNSSKKYWYQLWASIGLLIFYQAFLAVRCYQTCLDSQKPHIEKLRAVYLTGIYIIVNINHVITVLHFGEHHKIINSFLETTKSLANAGPTTRSLEICHMPGTLRICLSAYFFISGARALGVFAKPESAELFTSLTPQPKLLPFWVKFVLSLVHFYITGFHIYFFTLYGVTMFCFVCAIPPILRMTKVTPDMRAMGQNDNWSPTSLYSCYNQLTVLQHAFNSVYGIWPWGCELTVCIVGSVNLFLAVVLDSARCLIIGAGMSLLLILFFTRFAQVHTLSMSALESWRMRSFPQWFRKFQKAVQPIRINIGGFFYADKGLVLTIIGIIVQMSINLILGFRET